MAQNSLKIKKRAWGIVFYPESAPANWREILEQTGLPVAISPLHCNDTNATGEPKKAHYHALLVWANPTTQNNVKTISDALNAPLPTGLESVRGAYDYLTHKNNPEKAQYDDKDIIRLNGFNIANFDELTKAETLALKREALAIIRKNALTEYCDLCDLCEALERYDLLDIVLNNTIMFNGYLKSRRYRLGATNDNTEKTRATTTRANQNDNTQN